MNRCKVCVAPVLDCKERRRLDASSSEHCRAVLVDLACNDGTTRNDAAKEYGSGYVCKKCFGLTAKYLCLKEDITHLRNQLQEKLHLRSCSSASASARVGTKRSADSHPQGASAVKVSLVMH